MRSIFKSTRAYEAWMRQRTDVSGRLLKSKHRKMGAGAFPFLRATFYRWVEQWPKVCPRLAERDQDVLLVKVEQVGAACHEGYESCFFREYQPGADWKVVGTKIFDPEKVYG